MRPFDSVEEAIRFGDELAAGEFCCFVLWNGLRYSMQCDRAGRPVKIALQTAFSLPSTGIKKSLPLGRGAGTSSATV